MQVPGLPDALNGFRIAQLSDLHIGPTFGKAWLTDVVARTDSLNPDLIVNHRRRSRRLPVTP